MSKTFTCEQILNVACHAGRLILENGGEIYRAEQTVAYVCKTYGASQCACFATPTTLIVTADNGAGETQTRMNRITKRQINLHKVGEVNNLSRALGQNRIELENAEKQLERIESGPEYSTRTLVAVALFASGAFAYVFGGGIKEMACAAVIGALLRLTIIMLGNIQLGDFFINFSGGIISSLLGWLAFAIFGPDWWTVTVSVLMLMVPGLLLTNALRDIAAGDLISGITRATEAFCIAAALAGGSMLVYSVLSYLGGFSI